MKTIVFIGTVIVLLSAADASCFSHPDHTDAEYLELNDYLMAIQVMRQYDMQAATLFKSWQEIRAASWKIRELTDEQNLGVNTAQVMEQIVQTGRLRRQLLLDCRAYFAKVTDNQPSILFEVDEDIVISWADPVTEVPQFHSKVILIEIRNARSQKVRLIMQGGNHDQILFWNKIFDLAPQTSRYTFAIVAPQQLTALKHNISLQDTTGKTSTVSIRALGTPSSDPPYQLMPGESIYRVTLPQESQAPADTVFSGRYLEIEVNDASDGRPLAARIEVRDNQGHAYWSPLRGPTYAVNRGSTGRWNTTLWKYQPGPYFYLEGRGALGVDPAQKTISIYHGFEYRPVTMPVPDHGKVKVALERWIDMPAKGWYAGHTHIHTTDVGMPVQFTKHWPIVSRAEDLHVSSILTLKGEWDNHAIYAGEYPPGERTFFSTSEHLLTYGQEYRNNPYGHLALVGLDYLIQPISSGALGELGGPDYPPNALVLDEAIDQGAVTIGAHFGYFIAQGKQIKSPWPSTGFEMPANVALGKMHLAEIYGEGGQLEIWYDLLNCGFMLPATAGPDWAIKDTPRVYVMLDKKSLTVEDWLQNLKNGRSFITKGPMLFFTVNGQQPGSHFQLTAPSEDFKITAQALTPEGDIPVEILFNGEVITSGSNISTTVSLNESGWLAARCQGAHSNPIYLSFEGKSPGKAAPAQKFMEITDRLIDWVHTKGLYYTPQQKQEVLENLNRGKKVFQDIVDGKSPRTTPK